MSMSTNNDNDDWYTPVTEISSIIDNVRKVTLSRKTHSIEWRKLQIMAIQKLLDDNFDSIAEALKKDMGQCENYVEIWELSNVRAMAQFTLDSLDEWVKTKIVPTPFPINMTQPIHSEITPYPRGMVLLVTPWNFPFALVLSPLINIISAGCTCILKPSEISIHSSKLLCNLLRKYLDQDALQIVLGGVDQATELLKYPFDAISYTGNSRVGKIIATAAAKHLTPTLLELGGKNPAIVCDDADIDSAVMRICWGKFGGNVGQICLNTDYVLVTESIRDKFISKIKETAVDLFTKNPKQCKDYGRMISIEHTKRVLNLIDTTCTIIHGGMGHDVNERYIAPTIVEATTISSTIMSEEIFGPILAIITVPNINSAIQFVNEHYNSKGKHPLMLYVFSKSKKNQREIMSNVLSGMCCVNHVCLNGANSHLPFGGVGVSGMNAYYGKHGFDFFSHNRGTVVLNNFNASRTTDPGNWMLCPPYTKQKLNAFRLIQAIPKLFKPIKMVIKYVLVPILASIIVYQRRKNPSNILTAVCDFNINTILQWLFNTKI